jgi:hypothetical protein
MITTTAAEIRANPSIHNSSSVVLIFLSKVRNPNPNGVIHDDDFARANNLTTNKKVDVISGGTRQLKSVVGNKTHELSKTHDRLVQLCFDFKMQIRKIFDFLKWRHIQTFEVDYKVQLARDAHGKSLNCPSR